MKRSFYKFHKHGKLQFVLTLKNQHIFLKINQLRYVLGIRHRSIARVPIEPQCDKAPSSTRRSFVAAGRRLNKFILYCIVL